MKTIQEITDICNSRIDAGVLPALNTQAKKNAYIQKEINKHARAYLASTDWYVIRLQETGELIPADVATFRAEARARVV